MKVTRRAIGAAIGAAIAAGAVFALSACSLGGESTPSPSTGADGEQQEITLVTHDSFALSEDVLASFTEETGITVTQVAPGDAGALVNQLVLTKDSPLGDVVYGVDNTFASRAVEEGVVAPYISSALPASAESLTIGEELTPIDHSDVCLNVDLQWFDEHQLTVPESFDDLLLPEYKGLTVALNPATSSPGLAFVLATIGAKGEDGWIDYWTALRANDLRVVDGWSDAYYVDFTGGGGDGDRPIVVSYASSPPSTVGDDGTATTAALLDTCFRQVEYAGVLAGAENPDGAQEFIDFLLSDAVQEDVPGQMYVYPVNDEVALPEGWAEYGPLAENPYEVDPAEIDENRSTWIDEWTAAVLE